MVSIVGFHYNLSWMPKRITSFLLNSITFVNALFQRVKLCTPNNGTIVFSINFLGISDESVLVNAI
jgi:hypothetical protein